MCMYRSQKNAIIKTISCGNIKSNQTKTTSDISDITTTDITDITSTSGLTASKTDSALTCSSDARITYSSLSLPSAKEKLKDVNQSHNDGPESAPEQEIISAMGNLSLDTASSASQPKRWVDPDDPYDRVSDPVKKIFSCQKPIEPYRSVVYANDPGSPPLSRFATGHDEYVAIDEPVAVDSSQYKDREETIEFPAPPFRRVTRSSTSEAATVAGSSRDANQVTGGGDESLGAWGGSSRPANVLDLVRTQVRSFKHEPPPPLLHYYLTGFVKWLSDRVSLCCVEDHMFESCRILNFITKFILTLSVCLYGTKFVRLPQLYRSLLGISYDYKDSFSQL
ncbi:histone deacetylase 6-like isoform X3 [Biomphalaria glabrata]